VHYAVTEIVAELREMLKRSMIAVERLAKS